MLENLVRKLLMPALVVGALGGCGPKGECERDSNCKSDSSNPGNWLCENNRCDYSTVKVVEEKGAYISYARTDDRGMSQNVFSTSSLGGNGWEKKVFITVLDEDRHPLNRANVYVSISVEQNARKYYLVQVNHENSKFSFELLDYKDAEGLTVIASSKPWKGYNFNPTEEKVVTFLQWVKQSWESEGCTGVSPQARSRYLIVDSLENDSLNKLIIGVISSSEVNSGNLDEILKTRNIINGNECKSYSFYSLESSIAPSINYASCNSNPCNFN